MSAVIGNDDKKTAGKQKKSGPLPRYRFRITVEGLMLLVVMVLVGFAAWHSGTNLLYLIFAILMALYLLHGLLLWLNLWKLKVTESTPETVVVDQPFDLTVALSNNKRFAPSHAIRVTYRSHDKADNLGAVYFGTVRRGQIVEKFISATLKTRGLHTINRVTLSTRYPFGFEERGVIRPANLDILALPRTYNIPGLLTNLMSGYGDQESHERGVGTELYGLREYVPGEHSRHIHWRTSVRAQKLMIMEYSRDERRRIMLFLDNGLEENYRSTALEAFENAIILTASLARHYLHTGYEVGLITADAEISHGEGSAQLITILRHLATLDFSHPHPYGKLPARLLKIKYHSIDDGPASSIKSEEIDSRLWTLPGHSELDGERPL